MAESEYSNPPSTGNVAFDKFMLMLFRAVFNTDGNNTGGLNDRNIIAPIVISTQDIIITGDWTFAAGHHPIGLLHNLIGNLNWNVAGHVINSNVNFNGYNIENAGDVALDSISGAANTIVIGDGADTITLNPTAEVSFSAKNISNVGDISLDSITKDSGGDVEGKNQFFWGDNLKILFGTGKDAGIYYDGTDLWIDPALVGSGSLKIGTGTTFIGITRTGQLSFNGTASVASFKTAYNVVKQNYRVSTQFDKTNDAALANVTGLSATVEAGKTYKFKAQLFVDSAVAGGHQVAISGTCTATNIIYQVKIYEDGAPGVIDKCERQTALGGATGDASGTQHETTIEGTITVNAGGTLTVQFAQQAANATPSSVLVNSTFSVEEV